MTTVQDIVFRADGSVAQGTLLISWPAFTTSGGSAIGAGSTSVKLTPRGTFSTALVPNANATPATVYTVVYQLEAFSNSELLLEAIRQLKSAEVFPLQHCLAFGLSTHMSAQSDETLVSRPKQRANAGRQPLVVRGVPEDSQPEVLGKLTHLENSLAAVEADLKLLKITRDPKRWDARTLVAVAAIALSITGYVIQDARNSSRQDAEIEMTKARVSNLEHIATSNTEARIRTEVELKGLREGQEEIKRLLQQHDNNTRVSPQRPQR